MAVKKFSYLKGFLTKFFKDLTSFLSKLQTNPEMCFSKATMTDYFFYLKPEGPFRNLIC